MRQAHEKADLPFVEVYVKTSLNMCEKRDVRGLYKKARQGLIAGAIIPENDNPLFEGEVKY